MISESFLAQNCLTSTNCVYHCKCHLGISKAKAREDVTDQLLGIANLTVDFASQEGTVHAVDKVSFSVAPGERVGFVGGSGCGRSVTASAILGLTRMVNNAKRQHQRPHRVSRSRPAHAAREPGAGGGRRRDQHDLSRPGHEAQARAQHRAAHDRGPRSAPWSLTHRCR